MMETKILPIDIPQAAADAHKQKDRKALARVLDAHLTSSALAENLAKNIIKYVNFLTQKSEHISSAIRIIEIGLNIESFENKSNPVSFIIQNAPNLKPVGQAIEKLKTAYNHAESPTQKEKSLSAINKLVPSLSTNKSRIYEYYFVLAAEHGTHRTQKSAADSLIKEIIKQPDLGVYQDELELIKNTINNNCKTYKIARKLLNGAPKIPVVQNKREPKELYFS